jgi:uncharacterized protein (DUF1330 family)
MPKGYIVAEITVHTPGAEWDEYRGKVLATLQAFGGRFLTRGGGDHPEVLEGDGPAGRIVILEFDSQERARDWYNSPAYQDILPLRLRNAGGRVTCSAGV